MMRAEHALGQRAEAVAGDWLRARGWQVLERRWRTPAGELDLVCLDPSSVLVGVEVKLRTTSRAGSGAGSVDSHRVRRLRRALATYAATAARPNEGLRLDLVTFERVEGGRWRLRHLRAIDAW